MQDSQFYSYGPILQAEQVLTVVDEMNTRVQQQLQLPKESRSHVSFLRSHYKVFVFF